MFDNKNVLITGGTGSFGQRMTSTLLERYSPNKVIVLSRDELKQHVMRQRFSTEQHPCMRYFIGDVRDEKRLHDAFRGVNYLIHAAALKQVPTAEYNPFEAIKTNVIGGQNIIRAAIDHDVEKVIALSTDKAANPINLYGATKLCSDKLFIAGNHMAGRPGTAFSVVRYGNVAGSRGSVIPFFLKKREEGVLPITDPRMTRFSITLQEGVDFVLDCMDRMHGGELFVPKLPSYRITDVAQAIAPEAEIEIVGIRPGEKLHEVMIPVDESRNALEFKDYFVVQPAFHWWDKGDHYVDQGGTPCPDRFCYSSGDNDTWLTVEEIRGLVDEWLERHGSH